MDISVAITGIDAALKTLRGLRELEKSYDAAVLKGQLVDLMEQVTDAKMALVDARGEISQLKEKLNAKAKMVEFKGQFYAANEAGEPIGVPYCGACLVEDGTQIRYNSVLGNWLCPRCKATASVLHICKEK